MALLNVIDKTTVAVTEFDTGSSDLVLRIPLTSGETIQFTAETQFFTPRNIATSKASVLGLPSQSVVEYTAGNIPVVKMPIGAKDITTPQFYAFSVESDQYVDIPIDNFFRELVDDLELPDDDPNLTTLRGQREATMQAAMALDDFAAAIAAGDLDAAEEANAEIDEGLAEATPEEEPDPSAILSADEADELAALDFVGLADVAGLTDGADDIIDPTPEVLEEDLIQRIPRVPGNKKVSGIETVNKAIDLLNGGIQEIEGSLQQGTDEEGKCKFITVAKGKKGFRGIGKKKERKVSRADTEKKLKLLQEDIAAQEASPTTIIATKSGVPTTYKITKSTLFGRVMSGIQKAGFLGTLVGVVAAPFTAGASLALAAGGYVAAVGGTLVEAVGNVTGAAKSTIPKGYAPMKKTDALKVLRKTAQKLEAILAKDCN